MNIELQELRSLRDQLTNKSCLSCINGICRVPTREKVGMEYGKPAGSNCIGWENDALVKKAKILKIYDVEELRRIK